MVLYSFFVARLILDMVRITLTDQTDAKLLLGTYVTDTPGSFTWRAGILTTAVREGKWIVIEDIERAGNDVLSVLLPLLEGRPLELAGRGQVEMSKGCQIIATTRSHLHPFNEINEVDSFLGQSQRTWRICSASNDGLE
jgi:midasin